MTYKEHLNENGFRKVIELREILNEGKGRKRKYTISELLTEESSETIRKTDSIQIGIPTN